MTHATDVPTSIPMESWRQALIDLGIPVAGAGLIRVEASALAVRLTYTRRDSDGQVQSGIDGSMATETYEVALARPEKAAS